MAGFALIVDQQYPPLGPVFGDFLKSTATYKSLDIPDKWAKGTLCIAAKLDARCSLHKGITRDAGTGSWLLAAGTVVDQPNTNPDGSLEKILLGYLDQGEKLFSQLDGQFAMVINNSRDESILVISDPFGLIPIYYGQKGSQYYISTSALAVAKIMQSPLSEFGARSFIAYGSTFGDTLWENVHMLPPATILKFTREGINQSTYWTFEADQAITVLPERESVNCMVESLSGSLRRSLQREGKVWISLTGGLDSRTLAALAKYNQVTIKTYCHGPMDSRDVRIAEEISQKMGWEHEYFPLPDDWGIQRATWLNRALGQTDGLLDVIKMTRTIREQTRKANQLDVSLWGYGGELYRGYYWKQEFWKTGSTSRVSYERLMDLRVIPSGGLILKDPERWNGALRSEITSRFQRIGEQQPDWPNTLKLDLIGTALERHACGITIGAVLGQQRVILPFDFKENIRCIFSINYKWRTHGRMFRLILERINPGLAETEIADGGPALPMRLSNFYQFVPYWVDSGEKLIWRVVHKATGKVPWQRRDAGPAGRAYPTRQWLQDTLVELSNESLLVHDRMLSGSLYEKKQLDDLISRLEISSLTNERILGRILAVEMALRSVAMSV